MKLQVTLFLNLNWLSAELKYKLQYTLSLFRKQYLKTLDTMGLAAMSLVIVCH